MVHAEPNAILNAISTLKDCTIFVTLFPCHECAKLIIQSGIKEVVFLSEKYLGTPSDLAAKKMFDAAFVTYRKLAPFSIKLDDEQ